MGILVADRIFFGEIGALDGGMKIYGGENVELGIRVSHDSVQCKCIEQTFVANISDVQLIKCLKLNKDQSGLSMSPSQSNISALNNLIYDSQ